ncbi:hypothetical protein TNCV_4607871 [Trichonephila clavipes]|nr:hypothetical protein TNCV_4607871 [Trichonephila clavipes]
MDTMRLSVRLLRIPARLLTKSDHTVFQVKAGLNLEVPRCPRASQTHSIGLRSGEHAIHSYAVLSELKESSSLN